MKHIKEKEDKQHFIKIKNFCSAKNTIRKFEKANHRLGETFSLRTSDKRRVSAYLRTPINQ